MGNSAEQETSRLADAERRLRALLPATWSVRTKSTGPDRPALDARLVITSPNGDSALLVPVVKRWSTAPTSSVIGTLRALSQARSAPILLVTDYVNRPLREACEAGQINYLDQTGWAYFALDSPAMLIRAQGGDRPPARRFSHAVTRLTGKASARLIRTLLTAEPPLGVRELALQSGTSPSSAAKVLPTLATAGAIERDDQGQVTLLRRRQLLERWTADYQFLKSNRQVGYYLAPRGVEQARQRLTGRPEVALTGVAAARAYLPAEAMAVVPTTTLTLYSTDIDATVASLRLLAADRPSANVLIAEPVDPALVQSPAAAVDGIPVVALPQVLADLLTMPGRESLLAEQLMDHLASTDPTWKEHP